MKTFFDLKQEVQVTGKCHGCGGCVSFCTAVNYGAIEMGQNNLPRYASVEKCIDCGLCYQICPAVENNEEEIRRLAGWSAPAGRILGVHSSRILDPYIRGRATDGGAVTALLLHLFDKGHINGAIVTQQDNGTRKPLLAMTRDEIVRSAGTSFENTTHMEHLGLGYSTYSPSIQAMSSLMHKGLRRIAFVGTPCQIKAVRKMQVLNIVPSEAIQYCFGLFCSANYTLDWSKIVSFPELDGKDIKELVKINIKEDFVLQFRDGESIRLPLDRMSEFKRPACNFCHEFSAEFADISFGGIGSDHGWTTVVTRTPLGRAVYADALGKSLEEMSIDENKGCADRALAAVMEYSEQKRLGR